MQLPVYAAPAIRTFTNKLRDILDDHRLPNIDLKVLSTLRRGAAYMDIVKDGQTILTRDLDIENG